MGLKPLAESAAFRLLPKSYLQAKTVPLTLLSNGADGYIVKSDAESELLPAVRAVLQRKRFSSASLAPYRSNGLDCDSDDERFLRSELLL